MWPGLNDKGEFMKELFYEKVERDNKNAERIGSSAITKFKRKDNHWWVKSQSVKNKRYKVWRIERPDLGNDDIWSCQCMEFIKRITYGHREPCKHILAVQKSLTMRAI